MTFNKSKAGAVLLLVEDTNIYILLVLGRAANKWGIPKGSIYQVQRMIMYSKQTTLAK